MDFSLTVRDNHSGAGGTARDDIRITVADADAFTVTSQYTQLHLECRKLLKTLTWSKGTSDVAPINCQECNY